MGGAWVSIKLNKDDKVIFDCGVEVYSSAGNTCDLESFLRSKSDLVNQCILIAEGFNFSFFYWDHYLSLENVVFESHLLMECVKIGVNST